MTYLLKVMTMLEPFTLPEWGVPSGREDAMTTPRDSCDLGPEKKEGVEEEAGDLVEAGTVVGRRKAGAMGLWTVS